jgi:SAM-dependent methyltransferase
VNNCDQFDCMGNAQCLVVCNSQTNNCGFDSCSGGEQICGADDVGCGPKPYYPFFADRASEYIGVDVVENPAAELLGSVEDLPVPDASFDLVLCTQVLEHCDDPAQAVRELRRVTAPGGKVRSSACGNRTSRRKPSESFASHPAISLGSFSSRRAVPARRRYPRVRAISTRRPALFSGLTKRVPRSWPI